MDNDGKSMNDQSMEEVLGGWDESCLYDKEALCEHYHITMEKCTEWLACAEKIKAETGLVQAAALLHAARQLSIRR